MSKLLVCGVCGKQYPENKLEYIESTSQYVCEECSAADKDRFSRCSECGELHDDWDEGPCNVKGKYYCRGCFYGLGIWNGTNL